MSQSTSTSTATSSPSSASPTPAGVGASSAVSTAAPLPAQHHRVTLMAGELAVCRLPPDATVPATIFAGTGFVSVTRTDDELSIVCAGTDAASIAAGAAGVRCETGYRALKVLGPLPFDAIGVIARLSAPLAAAGISILTIATYDTDYILIRDTDVERANAALRQDGHVID